MRKTLGEKMDTILVDEKRTSIAGLSDEDLLKIVALHKEKIGSALKKLDIEQDGAAMSWRGLLAEELPRDICRRWAKNLKFWFGNRRAFNEDLRRIFNTFDMPMEQLRTMIRSLFETADSVMDVYLHELFQNRDDLQKKWAIPEEIRNCHDPLRLISYAVYGRPRTSTRIPSPSQKHQRILAWYARRKIAIALLIRSITQEPAYVSRSENARHFEEFLLRDHTGLINPLAEYELVDLAFEVKGDEAVQIHEVSGEGKEQALTEGLEVVKLIKVTLFGHISPYDRKQYELTVYALPGNRNTEDAKQPGVSLMNRAKLEDTPSLVDYKSLISASLKVLRGRPIDDYLRSTFIVRTEEEMDILQKIFDTALYSTVNRKNISLGGNPSTSPSYRGIVHIIEAIHNERAQPPRNYNYEIRIGLLKNLLLDRSKRSPAGHHLYRVRRALELAPLLFPYEYCSDFTEDEIEMAKKLKFQTEDKSNLGGRAATFP